MTQTFLYWNFEKLLKYRNYILNEYDSCCGIMDDNKMIDDCFHFDKENTYHRDNNNYHHDKKRIKILFDLK